MKFDLPSLSLLRLGRPSTPKKFLLTGRDGSKCSSKTSKSSHENDASASCSKHIPDKSSSENELTEDIVPADSIIMNGDAAELLAGNELKEVNTPTNQLTSHQSPNLEMATRKSSDELVDAVVEDDSSWNPEEIKLDRFDKQEQEVHMASNGTANLACLKTANALFSKKLGPLVLSGMPVLLSLAIVAFSALIVLSGLATSSIIVLMTASIPIGIVLRCLPQLQLMGYEELSGLDSSATSRKNDGKRRIGGWDKLKKSKIIHQSQSKGESLPWLKEVSNLVALSDYVYLLSDFRKMSLTGNVPVEFKNLELECDQMSQWDIIRGKPHTQPAFDEKGKGKAGIRSSTLIVTLLRSLFNKKNTAAHRATISSSKKDDSDNVYRGLTELHEVMTGILEDTSYSCDR